MGSLIPRLDSGQLGQTHRQKISKAGLNEMMGPVLSAAGRARIRPAPVLDTEGDNENRVVTLRIDFDEGKQFHFGKLMVLGNELHQGDSERIRDAWRFNECDVYNGEAVEKFWNDIAPYLPLGWQLEQHMEICQDASSAVKIFRAAFRPL